MNRLNCLIVDDEPVARKVIRELAGQVPFLNAIAECESVTAMEASLTREPVHLIFLDIQMPKRTGLDYLRNSPDRPMVIITTAYPSHALEGYDLDLVDYLVKPVSAQRFLKACCRARDIFNDRSAGLVQEQYLFVRVDKRIERLALTELVYAESLGNYVALHTRAGRKLLTYLTMKSLENQLPADRFMKIHQSYLVAVPAIESIEGNQARIAGRDLPISRNYRDALMKWIDQRILRR